MNRHERMHHAIRLLAGARHAVALTGAGSSTPSGIPDFRSPESGLWETVDPMEVASIWTFRSNPRAFYEWIGPLAETMSNAQPNPGHTALAELESTGVLRAVITQNIDGLHQRAGSKRVLELHGNLRRMHCPACGHSEPLTDQLDGLSTSGRMPRCRRCGEVTKPTVILFGEMLPYDVLMQAEAEARGCDVMLITGSSLEIAPASNLPVIAHSAGAQLIIVNYAPTPLDDLADVIIRDDIAVALPAIVDGVRDTRGRET